MPWSLFKKIIRFISNKHENIFQKDKMEYKTNELKQERNCRGSN